MKEKIFWTLVVLSSIGAAAFGYHRFKQIRPDLYPETQPSGVSESERANRIAEYQQKGDALSRAAGSAASRKLRSGETCRDGVVVRWERMKKESDFLSAIQVIENGQPVRCDTSASPPR